MRKRHEKLVINQLNDEKSFKLIFDSYFVSVYKRIFNIINNHVEAEEITQDIFIAMWNRRKQLNDIDNWKAYLIKAATFEAIDHLRKRKDFIEYTNKTEFSNAVVE
jgi:DNA-directed RNA polymerase specialized sigma24 family protein